MQHLFIAAVSLTILGLTDTLTGHVCSRQRAETYQTTYDRAFICPERYTTACGQLDWRRCTKYRVNTCYTPTEKYAVRYKIVEECCPGWADAGGGQCILPICDGSCENGGVCTVEAGVPVCQCPESYTGHSCQTSRWFSTVRPYLLIAGSTAILGFLVLTLWCFYRNRNKTEHLRSNREDAMRLLTTEDSTSSSNQSEDTNSGQSAAVTPTAPSPD